MPSKPTLLTLLTLLTTALAQTQTTTTTLSIFLLNTDPQRLEASIISVSPQTTSLRINCPPGTPYEACGYGSDLDMLHISSSIWQARRTHPDPASDMTLTWSCEIRASDAAVCEGGMFGADAPKTLVETATVSGTSLSYFPVVVTAGAELLGSGEEGTATATATATATGDEDEGAGAAETSTATDESGSAETGSGTASGSAASATGESGAAGGFAGCRIAGLGAAVAWVALLWV